MCFFDFRLEAWTARRIQECTASALVVLWSWKPSGLRLQAQQLHLLAQPRGRGLRFMGSGFRNLASSFKP